MQKWNKSALALLFLALPACVTSAPMLNVNDPLEVSKAINIKYDDFKKITKYEGPNVVTDFQEMLFIRAYKHDATGSINYQIYIKDNYYDKWRFYDTAYDSNGNRLNTKILSRDVNGCGTTTCSFEEHVVLNVTREYLEKNQDNGIRFKISGKAGEKVLFVPSGYIKAFLSIAK